MTITITITIDRDALDLEPLVIRNYPEPGERLWIPEDGITLPTRTMRLTYAPESAHIPGDLALSAVEAASSIPVVIKAKGSDAADLEAARAELEAATSQWDYDLTLELNGADQTYPTVPCLPTWQPVDTGMLRAHLDQASITFPVNPAHPAGGA